MTCPEPRNAESASPRSSVIDGGAALFGISVLALFLELLLIRWIATEVRIFAYLQNTVLVVCFLGLGMGCFTSSSRFRLLDALAPLAALLLLLTLPVSGPAVASISEKLSVLGSPLIWYEGESESAFQTVVQVSTGLLLTLVVMLLIWAAFVPLGRLLARLLDEHPAPIRAYSANVAGSLLGTWMFTALSAAQQPPVMWFGCWAVLCLPFLGRSPRRYAEIALLALIVATASYTGRVSDAAETVWSPYQKIALRNSAADGPSLLVNNVDYQGLLDLSEANVSARPERFPPELRGYSQYDLPMRLHASPREVLMVGAGSGNDAAGALRNGALHVTAVEIDPAIIRFGRDHHPEQPYQRPEVRVVVDDARSFFARTQQRYDVIVFGLLDSHTTHAMTNARLDHYVYTQESLSRARSLLAPGGILVLSFEAQKPYIASRIARTLTEEFGREPLAFRVPASAYGWGGVLFVSGDAEARAGVTTRLREDPRLGAHVERWRLAPAVLADHATRITTDDWPYLYLPRPTIPALYALLAGLLVVVFVLGARLAGWPRLTGGFGRAHMHFFALGAAFLLLEVQNISKACVALGNTWWVNAVVISGVLVMVLLANWTAARFPKLPLPVVFVCLLATCAGLYFLDLSQFGGLPYGAKALLVGGVTTTPMFFAGIVFVRSFAGAPHKDEALGANLVGSLVGALLQSITFLSGVRFLLWIVAAFYVVAWATRPKER